MLKACYLNSLDLARKHECKSIAFPCISTGVYGYPSQDAALVALSAVKSWLKENSDYEMKMKMVVFCVFLKKDLDIYLNLLGADKVKFDPSEEASINETSKSVENTAELQSTSAAAETHSAENENATESEEKIRETSSLSTSLELQEYETFDDAEVKALQDTNDATQEHAADVEDQKEASESVMPAESDSKENKETSTANIDDQETVAEEASVDKTNAAANDEDDEDAELAVKKKLRLSEDKLNL